ncbi:MAG: SusC/RagA family TonB-linked outer membrane protein [Prolixibacteraceae bacterium]|jgi:TonB-linked SusC/RagA family outer membrane protein|nr:SusC/RagA family TonB-linked outer membrane protein [Prolixibacteraceae bacterium]
MKKKQMVKGRIDPHLKKLLLMMRLIAFMVLVFTLHVSASVYSQQTRLSLNYNNVTIREILKQIEEQSSFKFLLQDERLDIDRKVNIQVKDETVDHVLDEIFGKQGVSYVITEKNLVIINPVGNGHFTNQQQSKTVSGKVTDSSGQPLPGVSVVIKGTTTGTITDFDGKYTLANVPGDATLVFSFVGMKTQEVAVAGKSSINVILEEETVGIEEVVAVGYGTMKKSDLTGSVTQVKVEDVSSKAINTFEQLLQGSAAGVQITQSSGAPGSGININIRGVTTLSGTSQPLVVIDGFTIDNSISSTVGGESWTNGQPAYNALATLNPNDIESIEILKDASATAIYGSRGANGVMIITTKTGKQGKDQINYSFRTDISTLPKKISVLNTSDFIDYSNEAYANSNMNVLYPDSIRDELGMVNTNWQDLLYRTAVSQDHQVTISGKNNKDAYSVMGAYSKQNGILIDTKYERISGRVNYERTVSRRLSLGYNINAVYATNNAAQQSHSNGNPSGSVVTGSLNFRPLVRAYTEEGDFDVSSQSNPLYMAKLTEDDLSTTDYNIGLYLDYTILKDLKFKSRIASRDSKTSREVYFPRGTYPGDVYGGFAYKNENSFRYYLFENTLSYIKQFNSIHRINAVAGYTWQKWAQKAIGLQASGFPNDNLTYNNFSLANNIPNPVISNTKWALASALGRINYVLKDRYLVTFTGRYDGASRLSENNKWAFFPSAALGWNVHNEEFLRSFKFISQLKLRGSYGVSGNQNIAVGATQAKLETDANTREAIGNNIYTRFLFNSFSMQT